MQRLGILAVACLGALTIVYLVFYVGVGPVMAAIRALGWGGFALFCAMILSVFALLSVGWFVLVPHTPPAKWPLYFWGRTVRDSAAEVLPLSQFGGFVIGARAVALHGVALADAYASTVVDVTTEMMAQIIFISLGAALFIKMLGFNSHAHLIVPLLASIILASVGVAGFVAVQHRGPQFAEKLALRLLPRVVSHANAFAKSMAYIYAFPWRIFASVLIHLAGWLASAAVSWFAVQMIGGHIGYLSMIAVESALSGVRSATVIVPSAMGVQEVTYTMLMPLFGLGPEIGLALSLLKRAANIALGVPVLLVWQGLEGRQALALRVREEQLLER